MICMATVFLGAGLTNTVRGTVSFTASVAHVDFLEVWLSSGHSERTQRHCDKRLYFNGWYQSDFDRLWDVAYGFPFTGRKLCW